MHKLKYNIHIICVVTSYLLCSFVNFFIVEPSVIVTPLTDSPTVGQSFSMECNVTVAKGIVGSVDIIWTVNGTVKRRKNNTTGDINSVHSDILNITELQLDDNNTVYYCEAIVNTRTVLNGNAEYTLIIGKYSL